MTERKTKIFLALFLLVGILIGVLICILPGGKMSVAGTKQDKSLTKNIEFKTTHTLCGHESIYTEQSPIQMTFSDEEEIKSTFPEWTLVSVSDEKIVLKKQVANYCPEHFFAYLKNKKIYIETLNGDKKDILNVAAFQFTEEEEKTLTDGIYINGKEMYISFVEDFTI